MNRLNVMRGAIRPLAAQGRCVGPALTVLTREGDNLAIHRALDEAQPGDVLVVNGNGDVNRALFGDLLGEICLVRGVVGVVIDGAARDRDMLTELGLPVWAAGLSPAGPSKNGPGVIGAPIACGGVVVNPGDVVVADCDGVAVVPHAASGPVLARLDQIDVAERSMRSHIHASRSGQS